MFSVTLETMDFEDVDFNEQLLRLNIAARRTGVVYAQPGGGEDIVYSASNREVLEMLIEDYFLSGDEESDSNLYASIVAV